MEERKELLNRALARSRPGDILHIAGAIPAGETAELLRTARMLRNLMAYPAAVETLDRVLAAEPDCVPALEQKVVCLARMGSEFSPEANALLERALALVREKPGAGEALALLGRLSKERWYRAWYAETADPTPDDVSQNCALAVQGSFHLWTAIDNYVESFARTGAYYDAINAVSLLALAGHLDAICPDSQPRPRATRESLWKDVSARAGAAVRAAAERTAGDEEEAYWIAATRLEWEIVSAADDGDGLQAAVAPLVDQVVRRAGTRRFLLDSTAHQLAMFRCLGFRPRAVGAALANLRTALRFTPDPAMPAHRLVFAECAPDAGGGVAARPCSPADAASRKAVADALEETAKGREDLLVLVALRGADSVACAEACRDLGVPYEVFLPSGDERYGAEIAAGLGRDAADRAAAVKRKAREINLMDACVGEKNLPPADRDLAVLRWTLACARPYGRGRVTALLSAESELRQYDGTAIVQDPATGVLRVEAPPVAARPRQIPPPAPAAPAAAPAHARAPDPTDEDVAYFMQHCASPQTRDRWNGYTPAAREYLMGLGLTWEPFGLGAPVMLETNTIGFEILTEGPNGERFGKILGQCAAQKIEVLDLQLVILLKALEQIPRVRRRLRMALGMRADALLMSINVDDCLIRNQDFVEVVSRHRVNETTLLEVNEDLEPETIARLRQVADTYKLRLALDDSNNMKESVRTSLLDRVDAVKVDFKFTRQQLASIGTTAPDRIMAELVALRQKDLPLVVEGIETEQDTAFIQNHWRKEHGPIYLQGWLVPVSGSLDPFFVPMNTRQLPKGYRFHAAG